MGDRFGSYLKKLRLENRIGLRRFAKMVGILPSNLCHIESGRLKPPQGVDFLKKLAKVLNLSENSTKYGKLFDLAAKPGEIPEDVKKYFADTEIVKELPVMARTIKNRKLTREEIKKLIEDIKKR